MLIRLAIVWAIITALLPFVLGVAVALDVPTSPGPITWIAIWQDDGWLIADHNGTDLGFLTAKSGQFAGPLSPASPLLLKRLIAWGDGKEEGRDFVEDRDGRLWVVTYTTAGIGKG